MPHSSACPKVIGARSSVMRCTDVPSSQHVTANQRTMTLTWPCDAAPRSTGPCDRSGHHRSPEETITFHYDDRVKLALKFLHNSMPYPCRQYQAEETRQGRRGRAFQRTGMAGLRAGSPAGPTRPSWESTMSGWRLARGATSPRPLATPLLHGEGHAACHALSACDCQRPTRIPYESSGPRLRFGVGAQRAGDVEGVAGDDAAAEELQRGDV